MNAVLTSVAAALAFEVLVGVLNEVPRLILYRLAGRIDREHRRRVYEHELLPRLLEGVRGTETNQISHLIAGLRCSIALWRERAALTSPAPGEGDAVPESLRVLSPRPDERQNMVVRRHPIVLLGPALGVLLGLVVAVASTLGTSMADGVSQGVWLVWGAFLGWSLWRVLVWRCNYFVVTTQRAVLVYGMVRRRTTTLPLARIADVLLHRSTVGRVFGYGELLLLEALADQHRRVLGRITYVPWPETLAREVEALLRPGERPVERGRTPPS